MENKNLKVLLINLHGEVSIRANYLHAFVKSLNYNMKTIHFRRFVLNSRPPNERELETLKKVVKKIQPDVIMISLTSSDFWDAAKITKMFKEDVHPNNIIWGGPHPTIDPVRCLEHVNVVCRGEGEGAISDYLEAIKNNKGVDKIMNLWVKKDNKIIKNNYRPLIQDLDALPFPDFSDEDKIYILGNKIFNKNPLPFRDYEYHTSFSRGCPFSCTYCLNSYLNVEFKNKYYRRRSVSNVMKELMEAKRKYPKLESMNFWDDVFMTDLGWLKEFTKNYKAGIDLPFFAYGHATLINEEKMALMKRANLNFFDIGIQSGSERLRKHVFKRIDSDNQILNASRIINRLNIPIGYDFIFSEFETEEDLIKGFDFILKLPKPFKPQVNKLAYYVNFEITDKAIKEGKINISDVVGMDQTKRALQSVQENELKKFLIIQYYTLLGKRFIPNFLIRGMFERNFHKKYPWLLYKLSFLSGKYDAIAYGLKSTMNMIRRGEFSYIYNRIMHKEDYF